MRIRQVWRSSPDIQFATQLVLGAVALVVASVVFAAIAEDVVTGDPLTVLDSLVAVWIEKHRSASLTRLMWLVTGLGDPYWLAAIAVILGIFLFRRSAKYWTLTLMLAVPGGLLVNFLLKGIFQRPRPQFNPSLTGYSFPSGHAMMATLMYGLMAVHAVCRWRSWFWRTVAMLISCFLILVVALSRVYIEAHYLSDVIAAIAAGCAWLVLCLLGVRILQQRKPKPTKSCGMVGE
jgi:undecaprenyl-diphosphatase